MINRTFNTNGLTFFRSIPCYPVTDNDEQFDDFYVTCQAGAFQQVEQSNYLRWLLAMLGKELSVKSFVDSLKFPKAIADSAQHLATGVIRTEDAMLLYQQHASESPLGMVGRMSVDAEVVEDPLWSFIATPNNATDYEYESEAEMRRIRPLEEMLEPPKREQLDSYFSLTTFAHDGITDRRIGHITRIERDDDGIWDLGEPVEAISEDGIPPEYRMILPFKEST